MWRMVEDAYMCNKYLATSYSILQPFIGNQVGCSQIRDSEDMRVPESAEPTLVLRTWDVCTRGVLSRVLCAKLFAEVFANVTIMVLKHFWDPMTEISGVTCPHWKVKECAHGGTVKNAPLWSCFCCSLIEGWQCRQKSLDRFIWAACIKSTAPRAQAFLRFPVSNFNLRNCGTSIRLFWFSTSLSKPQSSAAKMLAPIIEHVQRSWISALRKSSPPDGKSVIVQRTESSIFASN